MNKDEKIMRNHITGFDDSICPNGCMPMHNQVTFVKDSRYVIRKCMHCNCEWKRIW